MTAKYNDVLVPNDDVRVNFSVDVSMGYDFKKFSDSEIEYVLDESVKFIERTVQELFGPSAVVSVDVVNAIKDSDENNEVA